MLSDLLPIVVFFIAYDLVGLLVSYLLILSYGDEERIPAGERIRIYSTVSLFWPLVVFAAAFDGFLWLCGNVFRRHH